MSEIERKTGDLERRPTYDLEPVTWADVKQQKRERYNRRMRVGTAKEMALDAADAIDEIQDNIDARPHQLKNLIMQSFGFGAAELINDYLNER